jgi:hypothetical protein
MSSCVPIAVEIVSFSDFATERNSMQGTVLVLMALSGLGCHNKYAVAYGPPTYSALFEVGCYANYYPNYMASGIVPPSCYSPCYAGVYSGCYGACYPGAYARRHSCCFLARCFGCCSCGKGGYGAGPVGYAGALPYGGPGPFPGGFGPYPGGPGPFMGGPAPYPGGPSPFMGGPGPYPNGLGPWVGGSGPFPGGPGPYPQAGFGGPYEPPIFGYALQFNYGDQSIDSVRVPTVAPPAGSSAGAATPVPPRPVTPTPRDSGPPTSPPPPPPPPAEVPSPSPPKPSA